MTTSTKSIRPDELFALCECGGSPTIIDVREPDEFGAVHVAAARNVPLSWIRASARDAIISLALPDPLFVICRSGKRSAEAVRILGDAGYANVTNVDGGMLAWEECGLPAVREARARGKGGCW